MNPFSPAQLLGYLALVFGVSGFLQRDDRRLKLLLSAECFVLVGHFALLGDEEEAKPPVVPLEEGGDAEDEGEVAEELGGGERVHGARDFMRQARRSGQAVTRRAGPAPGAARAGRARRRPRGPPRR